MLDPPGARAPVRGTPNPLPNPLVPLPVPVEEAAAGVDAVLLTHTHVDHLDAAGVTAVSREVPWLCQPEDASELAELGFADLRAVPADGPVAVGALSVTRTPARHGRDDAVAAALGPASGYVVSAPGEPTLYLAGDSVWCPEVADALEAHAPQVVVVNAGGARFLQGGAVTMEAPDVVEVARAAPAARVVAVHMEAVNHCLETRAQLGAALAAAGLAGRVAIPADGEASELDLPAAGAGGGAPPGA